MPLLDNRGRLFGRFNLIDAGIAFFVLALIPLGYASWLVFRTPAPVLESISPTTIQAGVPDQLIDIKGRNLRPFLHILVERQGTEWLFSTPEIAAAKLGPFRPGTYDVVLYDDAIEVGRLKNGLTVTPPPPPVEVAPPIFNELTPREIEYSRVPQRIEVKGAALRQGLHVMAGNQQLDYVYESPTSATLNIPQLSPETYDLVIFDGIRELSRFRKALTVFTPVITSLSPKTFEYTRQTPAIQVYGAHLQIGIKFFLGFRLIDVDFVSPEHVEMRPQGLPVGTYDLKLSDDVRILAIYPKAITIEPIKTFAVVEAITPKVFDYSRDQQQIEVKGKNFRSGMRVYVGARQVDAAVETSERIRVNLPASLQPEVYDLWIGDDQGTEIARVPKGLTIQVPQYVDFMVTVRFATRPEYVKDLKTQLASNARRSSPPGVVLLSIEQKGEPIPGSSRPEILAGPQVAAECTFRVTATKRPDGPQFDGHPLKIGSSSFTYNGEPMLSNGEIISVDPAPSK